MSDATLDCQRIEVSLAEGKGYPILIGPGCLARAGALLRDQGVVGEPFILSDETVWGLYGERVRDALGSAGYPVLDALLCAPGEESKSLENWRAAIDRLAALEDGSSRTIFVLNLGGGVVGDLGGFVAATYRRGMPFVQAPTTLLAQVDSSVGGKTGVNHPAGKNLVGAFHQPRLVVIDPSTLRTLPPREIRAGLAEVVKYGLIRDAAFFRFLEQNRKAILGLEEAALRYIISGSCRMKAEIVRQDEREQQGMRTLLNFGHTFGHALEAATGYRRYLHGEAVAIGMLCAASISVEAGMLPAGDYGRIRDLLAGIGFDLNAKGVDPARVWDAMKRDKKFIHARNRFVLLERIGRATVAEGVEAGVLERALSRHL